MRISTTSKAIILAALLGTLAIMFANPATMYSMVHTVIHVSNLDPEAATRWTEYRVDAGDLEELFPALNDLKGDTIEYTYCYKSHVVFGIEYQSHDHWPKRLTLVSKKDGNYLILEASIAADTHEIDVSQLAEKKP